MGVNKGNNVLLRKIPDVFSACAVTLAQMTMNVSAEFVALACRDLPFVEFAWEFCRLATATAWEDATINSLFWIGGNYHCPVDLPDTTGLSWREGMQIQNASPIKPLLPSRTFLQAEAGAGAAASEAVLPWPPKLPSYPWPPESPDPPWRPSVMSLGPWRPPEHPPPLPVGCCKVRDAPSSSRAHIWFVPVPVLV